MNEQDRLVQVAPLRLNVDEGDVDAIRREMPEVGDSKCPSCMGAPCFVRELATVRTSAWLGLARRCEND